MRIPRFLPWWATTALVVACMVALGIATNILVGPYFERSFLDEASPLVEAGDGSGGDGGDPAPATTPADGAAPRATPVAAVLAQGAVRDGEPGHNGEGTAKVLRAADGSLFLRFEAFSVTNGPDLFVVLSPDPDGYADGALNLGGLKATDGNINYEIPAGTDLARYRSAVIWCRSFDVTFAVATFAEAM